MPKIEKSRNGNGEFIIEISGRETNFQIKTDNFEEKNPYSGQMTELNPEFL